MRITAYADRLLDDLDALDWPEAIKLQQRNWIGRSEGARVDFPVDGETHHRLHHPPGHPVRRHLHGAGARAPAGREVRPGRLARGHPRGVDRRPRHPGRGRRRLPQAGRLEVRRRAAGRGQGQDRRLHRRVRDQPGQRRAGPRLHRRLRADGLRHRRDHGRPGARQPRLRLRPRLRAADALRRRADRRPRHRPVDVGRRLRLVRREDRQLRRRRDLAWTAWASSTPRRASPSGWRATRHRRGHRQLPAARLAVQPPALLGRALPDRLRRGRRRPRAARVDAAAGAAGGRGLLAAHLRPGRRGHLARRPRCPATRTGSNVTWTWATAAARASTAARPTPCPTGPVPAGTSCATWTRTTTSELVDPADRAVLDGPARGPAARRRRPVRRRRRARRAAPAVRALLVQGAVRPGAHLVGRAVPQAVQPGHDPGLRLPRQPRHRGARPPRSRSATAPTTTRARRSPGCWARWASP